MTDKPEFRVRFDPRPVVIDRRALIEPDYSPIPQPSDETRKVGQFLERYFAAQLGMPIWAADEAFANYRSALMDLNHYRLRFMEMISGQLSQWESQYVRTWLKPRDRLMRFHEWFYLQHHRRLPGSTRTARLRKKRITLVQRFCTNYLKSKGLSI